VVLDAADELVAIDPQPADANGALRRWDAAWRARLDRLHRRPPVRAQCIAPRDCTAREVCELVAWMGGAASAVLSARAGMLRTSDLAAAMGDNVLVEMAWSLAVRRVVADEAARRRGARLSCEDLAPSEMVNSWSSDAVVVRLQEMRSQGDVSGLLAAARDGRSDAPP
jgi:hypothetical protein